MHSCVSRTATLELWKMQLFLNNAHTSGQINPPHFIYKILIYT